MKVKIKTADKSDCETVFNLTKQAFQDYLDPAFSAQIPALKETRAEVKEDIEKKEVLLAYVKGQPAGSVRFYSVEDGKYHLSRLGVLNKYQGQQVGSKLVKEVEQQVKKRGGEKIILYSAYRRKELLNFYQELGYEIEEVTDDSDYRRAKLVKKLSGTKGIGGVQSEAMGW